MDKHAPMITINVSQRDHKAPWFDGECRSTRCHVRKLERHYRSAKSDALKNERQSLWSAAFKSMHKLYERKGSSYCEFQIKEKLS